MRVPTDLRKYLEYTTKIKAAYGSVMDFIVKERLHWTGNLEPKGKAYFENPGQENEFQDTSMDRETLD